MQVVLLKVQFQLIQQLVIRSRFASLNNVTIIQYQTTRWISILNWDSRIHRSKAHQLPAIGDVDKD